MAEPRLFSYSAIEITKNTAVVLMSREVGTNVMMWGEDYSCVTKLTM